MAATQAAAERIEVTTACERWWAARYLTEHGHTPDEPPCDHDPGDCPPLDPPTPRCCAHTEETQP